MLKIFAIIWAILFVAGVLYGIRLIAAQIAEIQSG
jgi:hypothetical protein